MRVTPNSGIALIMVLGLLTVMIIMAVSFAISMRTERLAAGNYADTVRARELVHVGLARALNDLTMFGQYGLGTNGLYSSGSKAAYPDWSAASHYDLAYTNTSENVYLLYATNSTRANEATNYVPRALWEAATNEDEIAASNKWMPIDSIITNIISGVVEANRMGRIKYLILNCSGLLDANYVGGNPLRTVGTNLNEIAIANLGEIGSDAEAVDFHLKRRTSTDVRYETLADLNAKGDFRPPATNLFVYSRALPGYWHTNANPSFNCVGTQVNLSGSVADLAGRRVEITDAFGRAGFDTYQAGVLFSNLIDYVDSDSIPSNLEYCVESMPMINEVVVTNRLTVTDLGSGVYAYKIEGAVNIECWYPFVSPTNETFDVNFDVTFAEFDLGGGKVINLKPADMLAQSETIINPSTVLPFIVITRSFGPITINSGVVNPVGLVSKFTVSIKVGATIVDQVNGSMYVTNNNSGAVGSPNTSIAGMECIDPRFNFNLNPNNFTQWLQEVSHTIGSRNNAANNYLGVANDGDSDMFVANRPLKSVAELGYLIYSNNSPWRTVKLYGPNRHRVLDVFGLSTNTSYLFATNAVYRGLVNPNSRQADALAVVFANMPVDQYPGEGDPDTLTMDMARELYSRFINSQAFTNCFTNFSDIGGALTNFNALPGTPSVTFDNELKRESLFRNACGLLNVRQNVFTIIIEAQAASGGNIPRNPARQRAVAIVWRDPYTGEMFVRNIKWLGD